MFETVFVILEAHFSVACRNGDKGVKRKNQVF